MTATGVVEISWGTSPTGMRCHSEGPPAAGYTFHWEGSRYQGVTASSQS